MQRIGRWASPDPLWIHAEGGGEALNAYHYVSGNLLQARDPLGLEVDGLAGQEKAARAGLSGEKQEAESPDESQSSSFTPASPPTGTGGEGGWGEAFDWAVAREGRSETWFSKPKGSGEDAWRRAEGFSSWNTGDQPSGDQARAVDDVDYAVDAASLGGSLVAKKVLRAAVRKLVKDAPELAIQQGGRELAETGGREVVEEAVESAAAKGAGKMCFAPGTQVLMADGTTKAIEDIEVGDLVLADNPEDDEPPRAQVVIEVHGNMTYRLFHIAFGGEGAGVVEATGLHPFWTQRGWVAAEDLSERDWLLDAEGQAVGIAAIAQESRESATFNLTVDGSHTYFVTAGGYSALVHNQSFELGDGYTGRVDTFNGRGGASSFEVHVYGPSGAEVGVHGPSNWIAKHGHGSTGPSLSPKAENTLRSVLVQENRARGFLPPKGQANIKGDRWKALVRAPCP